MTRVLVTGGSGFLASHLIPKLVAKGYDVLALDRVPPPQQTLHVQYIEADITDLDPLRKHWTDVDIVVHLAAMAAPNICETMPTVTFDVNVRGTFNVLRASKEVKVKRFIFSSTAHVYGISPRYVPTNEVHPIALQDTYTTSKILGEELCRLFYANHNIPYLVLRMFNGYGPGQNLDYFIPATINQAVKTGKVLLRGRHVKKDFIYVDDMTEAIVMALKTDYVGELNVGSGVATTLETVAQIIANHYQVPLSFSEAEAAGPTQMQCDLTRMWRTFGWVPKTTVDEGLERTMK